MMCKLNKDEIIKAAILKGGQRLFQQFGLNKTTMEDIAKSIGKGKSTLYYYYKSKEEIFSEVILKEMQSVFEATQKAVNETESAFEKLRAFALIRYKEIKARTNLYNFVNTECNEGFQLALPLRNQFNTKEILIVKSILISGAQQNQFKSFEEEDLNIMAQVFVSAIRGVELDLIMDENTPGFEKRIEVIVDVLINGIKA
ncbi:MAG: TetR/AcrR family transcriptional regulator [Bacteroidota bacterium]|nr:TetR/AcrR family transcriptional regulator [Bacteroidota bacterium]